MKKLKTVVAVVGFCFLAGAQASPQWAWDAGKQTNNGAITIKSVSGGTYSGTQNPTGAVAKTNQSAVTQPPTVIIQATGGAMPQCVPKMAYGSARPPMPTCSAGYTAVWSEQSAAPSGGWYVDTCTSSSGNASAYNIGGSNLNFVVIGNSSNGMKARGFSITPSATFIGGSGSYDVSVESQACSANTYTQAWSATVCCK